jgi:Flp pilus assembly protein TadD
MATGSVGPAGGVEARTPEARAGGINALSAAYERNPADKANGITFASALRGEGRNDQALAVMKRLVIDHPKDRDVLSA